MRDFINENVPSSGHDFFPPFEHDAHRGFFLVCVWVCTRYAFVVIRMDLHDFGSLHGLYLCMYTFLCDGHDLVLC